MKRDPIDDDPRFKKIIEAVDEQVKQQLIEIGAAGQWGSCHTAWFIKKNILKSEYGIEWKSPKDLNPQIVFD